MHPEEAHVLIIEDNASNVVVITELLRMIGVKHIDARASGWQGLKLAESMPQVDLILLDFQLPYEDSYKILERIRTSSKLKHASVVALIADLLPQGEARARAAGFNDCLGKPLDFDLFPKRILTLLGAEPLWRAC